MLGIFRKKKIEDPREALRDVLGDCELPSFPAVVTAALEKVRDEDSSSGEIADLVAADPGLSVRLLGTVNSAAFALRHEVKNIHHAVSLMGRSQLESLLISMAVRDVMPQEAGPGFDSRRFWTAAARRATTGRALAELLDPTRRSESFTACLLQDLAVPILAQRRGPQYGAILEHWHTEGGNLARLEQEAFGWDHAEIGECLSREWEFPEHLAAAIGAHHEEDGTSGDSPLPVVRLVSGLGESNAEQDLESLVETLCGSHGLAREDAVDLVDRGIEAASEIAKMFT